MGYRELLALSARFERVLREAAAERPHHGDRVVTLQDGSRELASVLHVRNVMHGEVNDARAERGLPPVDAAVVEAADQKASGHADYPTKFALYCAEAVVTPR